MRKHVLLFLFSILFYAFTGFATQPKDLDNLLKHLKEFSEDPSLKTATWGFSLFDVKTGEELLSHNPDLSIIPASTMKIVTTGCALYIMNNDFRYETLLQYSGKIDLDGILHGDIFIAGSGDPSFGSSFWDKTDSISLIFNIWLDAINKLGIKKITGQIIADESIFDNELIPREWTWQNIGNYFAAGSSGLTINENRYAVYFKPGDFVGSATEVLKTEPPLPWVNFVNQVTTAKPNTGDNVYILGSPYSNTRWLTGTIPAGVEQFIVHGSLPDPAYFAAHHFHDFLSAKGIEIFKNPTTSRLLQENNIYNTQPRFTIATHLSPDIGTIIKRINTNSVNTYAENLLKTIAIKTHNKGTLNSGIEAVTDFWFDKNIDIQGFYMYDGSGLAQKNRITPRQLTQMLIFLANSPNSDIFMESLAIAGNSGTLARLFRGTKSESTLIAKSGFLSNVIAYTGYTETRTGKLLAFAIMVNDYDGTSITMRNKMVKIMDEITKIK